MYVVWKTRPLSGLQPCPLCGAPGTGNRHSLIPHLVASRRFDGRPTQLHLARLPSFRSCCLRSEELLQRWWQRVDAILDRFLRPNGSGHILTTSQAGEIRRKMAERLARARAGANFRHRQQHGRPRGSSPHHLDRPLRVLGLSWPCRADEIKTAFRRRAKQTHPDAGGRAEEFRAVYEAYETLLRVVGGPLR